MITWQELYTYVSVRASAISGSSIEHRRAYVDNITVELNDLKLYGDDLGAEHLRYAHRYVL